MTANKKNVYIVEDQKNAFEKIAISLIRNLRHECNVYPFKKNFGKTCFKIKTFINSPGDAEAKEILNSLRVATSTIDLFILDCNLSKSDRDWLLFYNNIIKKHYPESKVILFTSGTSEAAPQGILMINKEDYNQKYNGEELIDGIKSVLSIPDSLENIGKLAKAVSYIQSFIQVLAITFFFALIFLGIILFFYYRIEQPETHFIIQLLNSFEIFFIAPIPLLIIFSYKEYISNIFPSIKTRDTQMNFLNPLEAKKAFISSIIGIASTLVLSQLFAVFEHEENLWKSNAYNFILLVVVSLVFLLILILLYKILSNHHSHEN